MMSRRSRGGLGMNRYGRRNRRRFGPRMRIMRMLLLMMMVVELKGVRLHDGRRGPNVERVHVVVGHHHLRIAPLAHIAHVGEDVRRIRGRRRTVTRMPPFFTRRQFRGRLRGRRRGPREDDPRPFRVVKRFAGWRKIIRFSPSLMISLPSIFWRFVDVVIRRFRVVVLFDQRLRRRSVGWRHRQRDFQHVLGPQLGRVSGEHERGERGRVGRVHFDEFSAASHASVIPIDRREGRRRHG